MVESDIYKFFLERAAAEDVKKFCEVNGYYLEILDSTHFTLRRYRNG